MSQIFNLSVKTRSKRPGITQLTDSAYELRTSAPPVDGKANQSLIKMLANHFSVPKSAITIIRGHRSSNKIIRVQ